MVVALGALAGGVAGARPLTAVDFITMPRVADPHVSPDGRYVVYAVGIPDYETNKIANSMWLAEVRGAAAPRRLSVSAAGASSPRWAANGHDIYFVSSRAGSRQIWKTDMVGEVATQVTRLPLDVGSFKVSPDGRRIIVSLSVFPDCPTLECTLARTAAETKKQGTGRLYDRLYIRKGQQWNTGTRQHLFALVLDSGGVATGEPVALTADFGGDAGSIAISGDGRVVYFQSTPADPREPWNPAHIWRTPVDGSGEPLDLEPEEKSDDTRPAVSPDGRYLASLTVLDYNFARVTVRELPAGGTRTFDTDSYAWTLGWAGDSKSVLLLRMDHGAKRLFAIDVKTGRLHAVSAAGSVANFDSAGGSLVVVHSDLSHPGELFTLGAGGALRPLTRHTLEKTAAIQMSQPQPFSFAGWNGDNVSGTVFAPYGAEPGKKYPTVMLIHGGPQEAWDDEWFVRWNPQFYAGAGFGVVTINFHGTSGYGREFQQAVIEHWGDRPLEDLQKGWSYALANFPFLDGARACALGASYGGYMTNWIEGVWGQPWRCLVTHDGVLDNRMQWLTANEPVVDWEFGGWVWSNPGGYERFNPINHIDSWSTPMLVIHGGQDFLVPTDNGIATFQSLQARGVPSELLYFPDEGHTVEKPQNSLQWHNTVATWLKRWIGQ